MKIAWKNITLKDLAAMVSEKLRQHGMEAILVGGACVSIYSQNQYQSKDLDLITYSAMPMVKAALGELGFNPKNRTQFARNTCPFYIEFVPPPVAIGDQRIDHFNRLKTTLGTIKLLTPTDCVKDRLAAFFHWDDFQSLNQALAVAKLHDIDLKALERWAKLENQFEKYKQFGAKLGN